MEQQSLPDSFNPGQPEAAMQMAADWAGPPQQYFYTPDGSLRVMYDSPDQFAIRGASGGFDTVPGYYTGAMDVSQGYAAHAAAMQHCLMCNRMFASPNAVLQHLRDHPAHREGQEAHEADYLIKCQEQGMYAPPPAQETWAAAHPVQYDAPSMPSNASMHDNPLFEPAGGQWQQSSSPRDGSNGEGFDQLAAPPSEAYTGSDFGSGQPHEEQVYTDEMAAAQQQYYQRMHNNNDKAPQYNRNGRRQNKGPRNGRTGRQQISGGRGRPQAALPPAPEQYEQAFPPLNGTAPTAQPASAPKWVTITQSSAANPKPLRADAHDYQPAKGKANGNANKTSPAAEIVKAETTNATATATQDNAADASKAAASTNEATASGNTTPAKLRFDAPAWVPSQGMTAVAVA